MTAPARGGLHAWAHAMGRFNRFVSEDFLGGPRVLRLATVINLQKAGTLPFVALLIWATGNHDIAAYVYLGLHGSYGLCWLLKHAVFPDRRWEARVTIGGAIMTFALVLGPYWIAPVLLITDWFGARPEPPAWRLGLAIGVHTIGVAIMMVADAQKHFTLALRPGLIEHGMYRFVRHPNYLGEMMVYGAYALLVGHPVPWLVLAWVWGQVFFVNMINADASMARHPGFAAWKARTGLVLPRLRARAADRAPM